MSNPVVFIEIGDHAAFLEFLTRAKSAIPDLALNPVLVSMNDSPKEPTEFSTVLPMNGLTKVTYFSGTDPEHPTDEEEMRKDIKALGYPCYYGAVEVE